MAEHHAIMCTWYRTVILGFLRLLEPRPIPNPRLDKVLRLTVELSCMMSTRDSDVHDPHHPPTRPDVVMTQQEGHWMFATC
jgi:hypothetical protein